MNRLLIVALITSAVCVASAWAQDSGSTTGMAEQTPQQNVSPAAVAERAPSTWINAARVRHGELIQARVNNPRIGEPAGTLAGLTGSGIVGSTGGLSGLLDLLTQFTGGTSTPSTGDSGDATGGTSGTSLADLLALRDQLLGENGETGKPSTQAQVGDGQTYSGAIARLPKIEPRSQEPVEEGKFLARWAESMTQTVFTALAIGFQSSDFIDFLKDALRPVFFPLQSGTDGSGSGVDNPDGSDGSGSIV